MIVFDIIIAVVLFVPALLAAGFIGFAKGLWRTLGILSAFVVPAILFGVAIYLTMRTDASFPPNVNRDGDGFVIGFLWVGLVTALVSAAAGSGLGLLLRRLGRKAKQPNVF